MWGRCVFWEGRLMLHNLNEASHKKRGKEGDRYWEGDMKTWRERQGGRGRAASWLCAQRQENKPLKVIQLIHLDNTEASSYRPLPRLYTQTHTHTFHSLPDRPLHPHQLLSDCWKERRMKQTRGGGRRRKVRRDKGGRKSSWGSPWRRCGWWAPPSHLPATITNNLLQVMASLTDHPATFPEILRTLKNIQCKVLPQTEKMADLQVLCSIRDLTHGGEGDFKLQYVAFRLEPARCLFWGLPTFLPLVWSSSRPNACQSTWWAVNLELASSLRPRWRAGAANLQSRNCKQKPSWLPPWFRFMCSILNPYANIYSELNTFTNKYL